MLESRYRSLSIPGVLALGMLITGKIKGDSRDSGDRAPEGERPAPVLKEDTVKTGETLWGIAKRWGADYRQVAAQSNIEDPSKIFPGQKLKYDPTIYIVTRGDTLWSIAKRLDSDPDMLAEKNSISNPDLIIPGQELKLNTGSRAREYYEPLPERPGNLLEPEEYRGPDRTNLTSGRHIGGVNTDIDKIIIHITDSEGMSAEWWFLNPDPPPGKAVSAHYIIEKDGDIVQIVPEDRIAYHCRGHNKGSIGIEFVGRLKDTDKQTFTDKQIEAAARLIPYLQKKYGISDDHVYGHREFSSKECPGVANLQAIKTELKKYKP